MPQRARRNNRRDLQPASARFPSGKHHSTKSMPAKSPKVSDSPEIDQLLEEPFEVPLALLLTQKSKKIKKPKK